MKNSSLRVLIVEDDTFVLELLKMLLNEFFEHVDVASDAEEAYEKFENASYDIVFSDINMPKMSGLELFEKIREKNKEVSLVLITAFNDTHHLQKSIDIGVDAYLFKPLDFEKLKAVIEKVVVKHNALKDSKKFLGLLKAYQKAVDRINLVSKTDKKGVITYANDVFCKVSGYSKEELIGKPHNVVRHPDMPKKAFEDLWSKLKAKKSWQGIIKNRAKNGESYYVNAFIMPILDENGEVKEYIAVRENITPFMNPLTLLKDKIKENPERSLVLIKIDKYDILEDFYTDEILSKINNKLKEYFEEKFKEEVFFLGNGEYGFVCGKDIETLKKIQHEINYSFIEIDGFSYNPEIKMVVSRGKNKLEDARIGLKKEGEFIIADGLFEKKRETAKKNIEMIEKIKKALATKNIVSYFQAIVDDRTKKVVKYESLVRMIDEDKIISPYFFLDIAKKANLYHKITVEVLENSFKVLRKIKEDVSINISSMDISVEYIRDRIFELLEEHKDLASRIVFELLEDENIGNEKLIEDFVKTIRKYGCKLAIDDFGSGYSSFERIAKYKPDIIKIDGYLIKNILTDKYAKSMVKSIVAFAKENGIETVAEFVENEEIFNEVKKLGVDYSQGYYFAKPERIEV